MTDTFRKLVTVRQVKEILPIQDADAIEVAVIDGWKVVVKKGDFAVGDRCVYFEIDSWVPHHLAPFLSKGQEPKVYEGVEGNKLRTIKLRGQISQGLILPMSILTNYGADLEVGTDVTEVLGVKKWEPSIPANMAGQIKGAFPGYIRKTDQERCQNLLDEIFVENKDARYEVTIKLDGTSVTCYNKGERDGVCSRNLELKINEENAGNALVRVYIDTGLRTAIKDRRAVAVQGELMGPGIQKNREALKAAIFYVFEVQDLNTGQNLTPIQRTQFIATIPGLQHVPILHTNVTLAELGITNVDELLKFAEGPSIVHPVREGLVFKRMDGGFSFKAISNKFLEKEKD